MNETFFTRQAASAFHTAAEARAFTLRVTTSARGSASRADYDQLMETTTRRTAATDPTGEKKSDDT